MHTVIGVFDEMPQAQQARERLQQQFAPEQVHLGGGHLSPDGEVVTDSDGARQKWENRSVLAAFGSFWANLIESHAHSQALDGAMQRGSVVVAVQVDGQEQASRAVQVMQSCQAIEVQHGEAPRVGDTGREPQPWHAADERPAPRGGAPIGTHSLTGAGANVGLPERSRSEPVAEHGTAAPAERSPGVDLLGQRPDANRER